MTTAYTSLLGLALPVTGELSGTWGDTVNNSITSLLDSAVSGTTTISADADITLTTTTGAANEAREAIILWTAGGTVTRNITAPAQSKTYIVINKSSSTQSIVLRGAGPTTGVTIIKGEAAVCAWNGSDFIKVSNISGAGTFTDLTVTGVASFADGTAALPSITNTGDTNTGIFFPAADTIAFSEGGTESMRIDSSGNVGIGTSTVLSGRLNVQVDATNNISLLTYRSAFTTNAGYSAVSMWMNDSAATPVVYGALVPNITVNTAGAHSGSVSIYTTNAGTLAEKMRVAYDGNVGIGTTTPLAKLNTYEVTGGGEANVLLQNFSTTTNTTVALYLSPTNGSLTAGSIRSTFIKGINVGGGVTAMTFGTNASGADPTEKMRIDSSGIVLIGATSATGSNKLQVSTDASIYGLTVGRGAGASNLNVALGLNALAANTTGTQTVAVGRIALNANTTGNYNTAVGSDALYANTTGSQNTAVGMSALTTNTTASNNTGLGMYALYLNTTGANNTAVGLSALQANTTASSNTAVGYAAAYSNTTGASNVAIGVQALNSNTTANSNTAVGYQAGYSNTTGATNAFFGTSAGYANTGSGNVAIGHSAGQNATNANGYNVSIGYQAGLANTGADNTFVGTVAGAANTNGGLNAAFGRAALTSNTTGSNNVALGMQALNSNTTANNNTAVGYQAGYTGVTNTGVAAFGYQALYNSTGKDNAAFGAFALKATTTGEKNSAFGSGTANSTDGALAKNTTGSSNSAFGHQALANNTTGDANAAFGLSALYANTSGASNTAIGNNAGAGITTGSKNVIIGAYQGSAAPISATGSNYIVLSDGDGNVRQTIDSSGNVFIGTTTLIGGDSGRLSVDIGGGLAILANRTGDGNIVRFYRAGSNVGNINVTAGGTAYNTSSDYRLKNSIAPMIGALAKVSLLKPCTYKWNADSSDGQGFIAHELAEVVPGCVTGEKDAVETYTDEDGNEATRPAYQSIDTSFLVATLTAAIQELKAEFDAYKSTHP